MEAGARSKAVMNVALQPHASGLSNGVDGPGGGAGGSDGHVPPPPAAAGRWPMAVNRELQGLGLFALSTVCGTGMSLAAKLAGEALLCSSLLLTAEQPGQRVVRPSPAADTARMLHQACLTGGVLLLLLITDCACPSNMTLSMCCRPGGRPSVRGRPSAQPVPARVHRARPAARQAQSFWG